MARLGRGGSGRGRAGRRDGRAFGGAGRGRRDAVGGEPAEDGRRAGVPAQWRVARCRVADQGARREGDGGRARTDQGPDERRRPRHRADRPTWTRRRIAVLVRGRLIPVRRRITGRPRSGRAWGTRMDRRLRTGTSPTRQGRTCRRRLRPVHHRRAGRGPVSEVRLSLNSSNLWRVCCRTEIAVMVRGRLIPVPAGGSQAGRDRGVTADAGGPGIARGQVTPAVSVLTFSGPTDRVFRACHRVQEFGRALLRWYAETRDHPCAARISFGASWPPRRYASELPPGRPATSIRVIA